MGIVPYKQTGSVCGLFKRFRLTGDTPSVSPIGLPASPQGKPSSLPPALRGVAERKRGQGVCPALSGTRFDMNVGDDAHIVPQTLRDCAVR